MKRTPAPHTRTELISPGAFSRGADYSTWRPGGSGDYLLIYTRSGAGQATTKQGETHALRAGSAALWDDGAYQDYRTDPGAGRWNILWSHFQPHPHWRAWIQWPAQTPGLRIVQLPGAQARVVEKTMESVLREHRTGLPMAEQLAANLFERALIELFRTVSNQAGAGLDPRIRRTVDFLAALPRDGFDADSLAQRAGLSPSRFAHLFREQTGLTPQRLLEQNRLRTAKQLLRETPLSIQEVAGEVGYADPFYFSKRFRRAFGLSPRAWRNA